jgi:hypothetical protein
MLSNFEKFKTILFGLTFGVAFAVWVNVMHNVIDMPDVLISNSTNECVDVFNYREKDKYTCQNLPSRYNHIWVM